MSPKFAAIQKTRPESFFLGDNQLLVVHYFALLLVSIAWLPDIWI